LFYFLPFAFFAFGDDVFAGFTLAADFFAVLFHKLLHRPADADGNHFLKGQSNLSRILVNWDLKKPPGVVSTWRFHKTSIFSFSPWKRMPSSPVSPLPKVS
jgi:hypothetical protein